MANEMTGKLLVCEVQSGEAKHVVGAKDGRQWDFHTQTVWASSGQEYPYKLEWQLPKGAAPYAPGFYLLPAGTIQDGRKGVFVDRSMALISLGDALAAIQAMLGAGTVIRPVRAAA
jgi:hypothetical protein